MATTFGEILAVWQLKFLFYHGVLLSGKNQTNNKGQDLLL